MLAILIRPQYDMASQGGYQYKDLPDASHRPRKDQHLWNMWAQM